MMTYSNLNSDISPLIISFYTDDEDYPEHAKLLSEDCERLGLDYYIEEKPSTRNYKHNCNIKPFFIKKTIEKFKKPVLWIDVDGSIISLPELFFDNKMLEYDMAANCRANDATKIHVGSMWFNYTKSTISLIDDWCESVVSGGIDDGQFNSIWKKHKDKIQFYKLPQNYFVVLKPSNLPLPDHTCIVHRLSNTELKRKEKYKSKKK